MVTDEEFIKIVKDSNTISDIIRKIKKDLINKRITGGFFTTVKTRIKRLGIDTSHLLGRSHLKGSKRKELHRKKLLEILVENSNYPTSAIKDRLIKEGIFKNECSVKDCMVKGKWLGKHISLHLDHINGISNDHRLENLRLLCPNCHSQTDTYCGKAKKKNNIFGSQNGKTECKVCRKLFISKEKCYFCCELCKVKWNEYNESLKKECLVCKEKFMPERSSTKYCSNKCSNISQRIVERPIKEQLQQDIDSKISMLKLGKKYGVSDNTVKKWMKAYGIWIPVKQRECLKLD